MIKTLEKIHSGESQPVAIDLLKQVQEELDRGTGKTIPEELWHSYLNETRRSKFLQSLPDTESRSQWASQVFKIIESSNYSFETMLTQRVQEHPNHPLFQYYERGEIVSLSFREAQDKINSIAGGLYSFSDQIPRVAILSDNSLPGALTDLSCLVNGIFVSPLNPHFGAQVLEWIFTTLEINIIAVGSSELLERVRPIVQRIPYPVRILLLESGMRPRRSNETSFLELISKHGDTPVRFQERLGMHDVVTVLFTSGSTGMPKGVQYTLLNLITKRFARAAALPEVGIDEVFLCFLPLYHTFGRFLEMQGALFWGGTYVFTGNPSFETLLRQMKQIQPTGLISIPWRWKQICDYCLPSMEQIDSRESRQKIFRDAVGSRLRWGLSAAGALEPSVFHFFQRYGVDLCSGFGMTEATGGITMTPPKAYEDNTVGVPLPGVKARLTAEGELEVAGPYIAKYLGEECREGEEYWLRTGDIFRVRTSGYYEIIDRLKDIYKNRKGQTIAPGAIEKKLSNVPGIKRSFLVGDGRVFNVLLLVPELDDPVLGGNPSSSMSGDYFRRIITTLNQDLAPYERIVNYAVVDRDFDADLGELTPKGSYRRKVIEDHYSEIIDSLYISDSIEIKKDEHHIRIPRWFFRDLGILETDIQIRSNYLYNRSNGKSLIIKSSDSRILVGNIEYDLRGSQTIDLGLFARQPLLWIGNPALADFSPCKDGWDYPLNNVSPQVFLPQNSTEFEINKITDPSVQEPSLKTLHQLCAMTLFGPEQDALAALTSTREILKEASLRVGTIIRRRLEALAHHPMQSLRCLAYEILLLDEPVPDYSRILPSFLLSGRSFLSETSIENIANTNIEERRLISLRKRLRHYRTQLDWSRKFATVEQFNDIFTLLENFVYRKPQYYIAIRSELVNWALHDVDPLIAQSAEKHIQRLSDWLESKLEAESGSAPSEFWTERIIFEDRLSEKEIGALRKILVETTFLKQSTMLAFDEPGVDIRQVPAHGIWISRVFSFQHQSLYRLSVNTLAGRHYDLLVAICHDTPAESMLQTVYWTISLQGFVEGQPVVRRFGCYRPELGAMSMALVNDLTIWERIRELAEAGVTGLNTSEDRWRQLFIRGISAFFTGWYQSDKRIVPGPIIPANVVVPTPDFRNDVRILSLADWKPYEGPASLVQPIIRNFYIQTVANYPNCQKFLRISWIFDACTEALGKQEAYKFLAQLRDDLESDSLEFTLFDFPKKLDAYLDHLDSEYHVPLSLQTAIDRYQEWEKANSKATTTARENQVLELLGVYQLDQYGDLGRYYLYRHTFFSNFDTAVSEAFDRLLNQMISHPKRRPTELSELSDLMSSLMDTGSRLVASLMVFPATQSPEPLQIMAIGPEKEASQIVVSSSIHDRRGGIYSIREPIGAAEIGRLFRLSVRSGFPISVAEQEKYLLVFDSDEQVVGGICYRSIEPTVAHLDGIAISNALKGRGLGSALLEDFCQRMDSQGIGIINTLFLSREFFKAHGFRLDREWSGLVRFLGDENQTGEWS